MHSRQFMLKKKININCVKIHKRAKNIKRHVKIFVGKFKKMLFDTSKKNMYANILKIIICQQLNMYRTWCRTC